VSDAPSSTPERLRAAQGAARALAAELLDIVEAMPLADRTRYDIRRAATSATISEHLIADALCLLDGGLGEESIGDRIEDARADLAMEREEIGEAVCGG